MNAHSELSSEALGKMVSDAYDLTAPVTCELLASGLNDVFAVTSTEGANILKVYRSGWRTQTEVLEEIAALQYLNARGVRVALPIARKDGALVGTLTLPNRERQVVLFARAPGTTISPLNVPCCRRFGQTLAEIHNATDDFRSARIQYDLDHLLARPLRALEPLLDDRPDDCDYLRRLIGRLRAQIERLPADALDQGYCHGDFRAANLHWDEAADMVTAFDFELGGLGFRAYDIAYMQTNIHPLALTLLWNAPVQEEHEPLWAAFLDGYTRCRPLRPADRDAIPLFVAMRPIRGMGTLLQTARQNQNLDPWLPSRAGSLPGGDLFDRALRFLRAWDTTFL